MTAGEVARLHAMMTTYWPNLTRGTDPAAMVKAWALALQDVPLRAAERGVIDLSTTLKWPPSVAEVRDAARPYMRVRDQWDEKAARDAYECLGWSMPLYRQMQPEEQQRKRLK